jgi:AraC-like DNA-binding protein
MEMDNCDVSLQDPDMQQFYRTTPPEPVPQLLQIENAGRVYRFGLQHAGLEPHPGDGRTQGVRRLREHAHAVYHVVLYLRGNGVCRLLGKATPFGPGTLMLTSPGEAHSFASEAEAPFAYTEMTFSFENGNGSLALPFGRMLERLAGLPEESLAGLATVRRLNAGERSGLRQAIDRLVGAASESGPLRWYGIHRAALETMHLLLGSGGDGTRRSAPGRRSPSARLAPAREMLEQRYAEPLTVGELARAVHLSEGRFLRAFREAWGESPIACRQRLRIRAAETLLRTTNHPIKEIARRTGFSDVYYFSRVFKQRTGRTPGSLRASTP